MNTVMTNGVRGPRMSVQQRRPGAAVKPDIDAMLSLLRATLAGLGPIHPSLDLRSLGRKS